MLILACGALATEIRDITRLHRLGNVTLECLPGILHNRPSEIPDAVRTRLDRARGNYDRILLGYGDCGTGGELADIAAQEGIEMLPGAHCHQFFAGQQVFDAMHDEDPTAFYLTDYLRSTSIASSWTASVSTPTRSCATCTSGTTRR